MFNVRFRGLLLIVLAILAFGGSAEGKRKCFRRVHGTRNFVPVDGSIEGGVPGEDLQRVDTQDGGVGTSFRTAVHDVYLWPSLDDREKETIRDAFRQIHRRTCIRFNELDYKPWYHAERWAEGKPYVVIRKSKKFSGYSDNNIEDVNRRSLIYLSERSLNDSNPGNSSRGMVMEQLLKFMGFREEFLRPDAPSYIQPISGKQRLKGVNATAIQDATRPPAPTTAPKFSNEQLMWPFDPESITMPARSFEWFKLTIYCQARNNVDIGAGQRAGVLTRYCSQQVGYADPRMGPCVVPRKERKV